MTMPCPLCGSESAKIIYLGLPMRLCADVETCCCVFGRWSFVVPLLPVATYNELGEPGFGFMIYEGWYVPALWHWLFGKDED